MSRKSTPGAQKLDSVAHFFCCKRADQAQQAPHLLTDGIALLYRQDNPSVALSGSHQCGMNPAEIASIKAVEHSILLGRPSNSRICSTNGTNWTVGTPYTAEYIFGVAYGDGFYVCLGHNPAYTDNGTNWIAQTNNTSGNAIAYGNSVFVAVGSGIYRTASMMHASLQKDLMARLTLTALVPGTCRIDDSRNLTDSNSWTLLVTISLTNSPTTWTDSGSSNIPIRLYRVSWTP